jgi:hypothetical protein
MDELLKFVKEWGFPSLSIFLSVMFYLRAKATSDKSELLLSETTKAIQGWVTKIMDTSTDIMSSRPEVTGHKLFLAKIDAASKLTDAVTEISKTITAKGNTGEEAKAEMEKLKLLLDYHFHQYNTILDGKPLPQKANPDIQPEPKASEEKGENG